MLFNGVGANWSRKGEKIQIIISHPSYALSGNSKPMENLALSLSVPQRSIEHIDFWWIKKGTINQAAA